MAKKLPAKNIYWREVNRSACVTVERGAFVIKTANNRRAVAYWTGQEAREAQRYLKSLTRCKVKR